RTNNCKIQISRFVVLCGSMWIAFHPSLFALSISFSSAFLGLVAIAPISPPIRETRITIFFFTMAFLLFLLCPISHNDHHRTFFDGLTIARYSAAVFSGLGDATGCGRGGIAGRGEEIGVGSFFIGHWKNELTPMLFGHWKNEL